MPTFAYKALNIEQETSSGLVRAPSVDTAADILIEKGLTILVLKEKKDIIRGIPMPFLLGKISPKDIVIVSRQLSILVAANIPLVQSLKILLKQITNPKFKVIISEVVEDVEGGGKLSDALAKHPRAFDDFFVNIVRSGETSGKLDEVLLYLADQMEKDYDLTSKIKGAMIYPIFITSALLVVGTIMMIFVVPKITQVLKESGAKIPFATKVLIGTSSFLVHYWWLIALILFGIIIAFRVYASTGFGRYSVDLFKIKVPIFGKLFQKIAIVRFARSLYTLISGGVTLTRGFKIVSDVVGNTVYKNLILETSKEVEGGNPIATVFMKSPHIPPMVSQMLNVGEKTGKIDTILLKIADFYSREIDNLLRNLVTLIEPIVMIVMGAGVGLMVAAVILPMYNLASSV